MLFLLERLCWYKTSFIYFFITSIMRLIRLIFYFNIQREIWLVCTIRLQALLWFRVLFNMNSFESTFIILNVIFRVFQLNYIVICAIECKMFICGLHVLYICSYFFTWISILIHNKLVSKNSPAGMYNRFLCFKSVWVCV